MIGHEELQHLAEAGLVGDPHPLYPGAVLGVDDHGARALAYAGEALRYGPTGLLPIENRVPLAADTVFDLASLTKLVTTLVTLGELDDLDRAVAADLPAYRRRSTQHITPRHLLTHTSGLPAVLRLWEAEPSRRAEGVLAADPVGPAGTVVYSCTGFLVLQQLLQHRTGRSLDALVRERITGPLGLGLTYRPLDHGVERARIAATELRPELPDPRGIVHDENAAALEGVAGNAGLFGTVADLLDLGRTLLDALAGRRTVPGLDPATLRAAVSSQIPPGDVPYTSGLGFRIDDPGFMGGLADDPGSGGQTYGHTGFTGTSLVLDEARDVVAVILTHRVHPSREWSDLQAYRRRVHSAIATGADLS